MRHRCCLPSLQSGHRERDRVLFTIMLILASVGVLGSGHARSAPPDNPFLRGAVRPARPFTIAHAGASSLAPQNTLAAGRKALALGADVWGVDVRLTRDGVFVLMHDETLARTTDAEERFPDRGPWQVEGFTLAELRALDAGAWFIAADPFGQIAAGNVPAAELEAYPGEPIPTLREALEFVAKQGWLVDIEVKPTEQLSPEELALCLVALIYEMGTAGQAMVSSFDHDILRAVNRLAPALPTGALVIFAPVNPIAYLDELGADVYLPSVVGYTSGLLNALSSAGIGVHVWTYNDAKQLEHLVRTPGISGIYTDFPQRLVSILLGQLEHADR